MPHTTNSRSKTQSQRKTIGANPLDSVIPNLKDFNRTDSHSSGEAAEPSTPAPTKALRKDRLTIHLPVELIERAKNAVFWTPGLTLAALGEQALEEMLEKLETGQGGPFDQRLHELKGGRPLR